MDRESFSGLGEGINEGVSWRGQKGVLVRVLWHLEREQGSMKSGGKMEE